MQTLLTQFNFQPGDIIIVANNRQVLALKSQLSNASFSVLPTILTWNNFLIYLWEYSPHYAKKQLIDISISRYIFSQIIKRSTITFSKSLAYEVMTNYSWLKRQKIKDFLPQNEIQEYFYTWVEKYQHYKDKYNLIDSYDILDIVQNQTYDKGNCYSYGFKALTAQQQELFTTLKVQALATTVNNTQTTQHFTTKIFQNFEEELHACTHWAKELHAKNNQDSIVIIVPELERYASHFEYACNTLFKQSFYQTKEKSFNISIGKPLSQFPIIRDLLLVLEVHLESFDNAISVQKLITLFHSSYLYKEKQPILNTLLAFQKSTITKEELATITTLNFLNFNQKFTHSEWITCFNEILNTWGFNTHRDMTSDEYQVWNKYKSTLLTFNTLTLFGKKVSFRTALNDLTGILEQVIFSPQSGENQIQIMGLLEAEGLCFDYSWIFGIHSEVLPFSLQPLRFIPLQLCITHNVPRCDYEHIALDSNNSVLQLGVSSQHPIISYSMVVHSHNKNPSPFITWKADSVITPHNTLIPAYQLEVVDDNACAMLTNTHIKQGVKIIKDQNLCNFKGFANRLGIDEFREETIGGYDELTKGNILHATLEKIFTHIATNEQLQQLENTEEFIQIHLAKAMHSYPKNAFYDGIFEYISQKIVDFLEREKSREDWQVIAVEKKQVVQLSSLQFSTTIDRIDINSKGEKILFDYKLGTATKQSWCNAIAEPQLPIYALSDDYSGVCFISFKNNISYSAMAQHQDIFPKSQCCDTNTWSEQLISWESKLTQVANDFINGKADVLPQKGACNYCNLQPFCKIEYKI
jgi:hypothetical protein